MLGTNCKSCGLGILVIFGLAAAGPGWSEAKSRHAVLGPKGKGSTSGGSPSPTFDPDTPQEVVTTVGQTAFLHCRVKNQGDRAVLWMRQRDLHILTVGLHTYTNDMRVSAIHTAFKPTTASAVEQDDLPWMVSYSTTLAQPETGWSVSRSELNRKKWEEDKDYSPEDTWNDWTLRIRSAQVRDSGLYECQVSTEPKISRAIRLNVVVSKATIVGSGELFIRTGSDINITCLALESPQPPPYFYWYHGGQVLNYSARGGLSVTTDRTAKSSTLLLARARQEDSGNYSCVPVGAELASIHVHVLNGEKPAAMQHGNGGFAAQPLPSTLWFLTLIMWRNAR